MPLDLGTGSGVLAIANGKTAAAGCGYWTAGYPSQWRIPVSAGHKIAAGFFHHRQMANRHLLI